MAGHDISRITVVIPLYNERPTARVALDRLLKTELPLELDAIVVDDASTDGTVAEIQDLANRGVIRIVRHDRNRGKGAAIRTGIAHAAGEVLTVLDGDLEYHPEDYRLVLRPILEEGVTVVYGTRSFGGHSAFSFWYVIGNRLLSLWASFLFNTWVSDIETCFKVAKTDLWRSIGLRENGFGIEAEVTGKFLRRGERVFEVPISYRARTREEGKKLRWTDGVAAFWILLRIRLFGR